MSKESSLVPYKLIVGDVPPEYWPRALLGTGLTWFLVHCIHPHREREHQRLERAKHQHHPTPELIGLRSARMLASVVEGEVSAPEGLMGQLLLRAASTWTYATRPPCFRSSIENDDDPQKPTIPLVPLRLPSFYYIQHAHLLIVYGLIRESLGKEVGRFDMCYLARWRCIV